MLCRRAALYEVELVVLENQMAEARSKGYAADLEALDLYNRLGGNQRRTLESIGLDRTARELVPTLPYLHPRNREQEGERCGGGGRMTLAFNIEDALTDAQLLGAGLGPIASWSTWLGVLKAAYGLPLAEAELAAFRSVTGNRKPPSKRVDELWNVVGRRGGKSKVAAAIATLRGAASTIVPSYRTARQVTSWCWPRRYRKPRSSLATSEASSSFHRCSRSWLIACWRMKSG